MALTCIQLQMRPVEGIERALVTVTHPRPTFTQAIMVTFSEPNLFIFRHASVSRT